MSENLMSKYNEMPEEKQQQVKQLLKLLAIGGALLLVAAVFVWLRRG